MSTPGSSVTGGSTVADTKDDVSDGGTTLTLGRKHDLRNVGALPVLRLSVWGRELISKDKPLGVALVDLASLPEDGRAVVDWRPLEPVIGMDEDTRCGRCGHVQWLHFFFFEMVGRKRCAVVAFTMLRFHPSPR